MAQALEKVNVSPNTGKMFSFAQKMVILFQNSVFGEIQFSQKILSCSKNQPDMLAQQVLTQQIPIKFCYYDPPRSGLHEAAVLEKETKILKEGARGDRGSPEQNESPIPDISNALYFVSLVRVVLEILLFKKKIIILKICKNAQVN